MSSHSPYRVAKHPDAYKGTLLVEEQRLMVCSIAHIPMETNKALQEYVETTKPVDMPHLVVDTGYGFILQVPYPFKPDTGDDFTQDDIDAETESITEKFGKELAALLKWAGANEFYGLQLDDDGDLLEDSKDRLLFPRFDW